MQFKKIKKETKKMDFFIQNSITF